MAQTQAEFRENIRVAMVDNSRYPIIAGQPMPPDMTSEMENSMARLANPIWQMVASWALGLEGDEFPDENVRSDEADPIPGYLDAKVDDDTIKVNLSTHKMYVAGIPLASDTEIGGVVIGAQPFLFMTGAQLMLNAETDPLLVGGDSMVPTSRAVKLYVDSLITGSGGGGDMLKSTYDTAENGVVDDAERLDNQLPSYYLDWANFTGTPTTIANYGITDAYTITEVDAFFEGEDLGKKQVDWARILNTPVIPIISSAGAYRIATAESVSSVVGHADLTWDSITLTIDGITDISGNLQVDSITEHTGANGVNVLTALHVDTITEYTTDNGVLIDTALIKDSIIYPNYAIDPNTYLDVSTADVLSFATGGGWRLYVANTSVQVSTNFLPGTSYSHDLGNATRYWAEAYMDIIYLKNTAGTTAGTILQDASDVFRIQPGSAQAVQDTASLNNFYEVQDNTVANDFTRQYGDRFTVTTDGDVLVQIQGDYTHLTNIADSSSSYTIDFYKERATGKTANTNDIFGRINGNFYNDNVTPGTVQGAVIQFRAITVTDGAEDSDMEFWTFKGGAQTIQLRLGTGVYVNNVAADETELYVVAIDNTTGLLSKRLVSGLGSGSDGFLSAVDASDITAVDFTMSGATDILNVDFGHNFTVHDDVTLTSLATDNIMKWDGAAWINVPIPTSGTGNAYSSITDGTNTANASGSDTFKLRTANNLLTILVTDNDATHNDNVLLTINEANISHDNIADVSIDDHHARDHILSGSTHTASGLTAGWVIAGDTATTFSWRQLLYSELGSIPSSFNPDTHASSHEIGGGDLVDHDNLTNFATAEHFLQTAITNVSTALATGILTVTTGTGALGSITDSSTNWDTAYSHSQIVTGNPHVIGYADISDFSTGVSTHETSHADVLIDGDFTSEGLMRRGASAGVYTVITDDSTNWGTAYTHSQVTSGNPHAVTYAELGGTQPAPLAHASSHADAGADSVDHDTLTNTHNLTTDINHNTILNNHDLTTDIDHDTITNTGGNKHIDWTNATNALVTTGNITTSADIYLDSNSNTSHAARRIYWGDAGDWDTFIIESTDDALGITVGGAQAVYINSKSFGFVSSGALAANEGMYIQHTEDSSSGGQLNFIKIRATTNDAVIGDHFGKISGWFYNDATQLYEGARIDMVVSDETDGTEDARILFYASNAGTLNTYQLEIAQTFVNVTGTLRFGDANTTIYEDGSSNLTFHDDVSGILTLAQLYGGSTPMVYPGAGIALSTGSAWGTSITDNSADWDTAFGWGDHDGLYDTTGTAAGLISTHESTYNHTNYNTAYSHSQIVTGNPHSIGYADISDFNTGVSTYETSHTGVVSWGTASSQYIVLGSTAGAIESSNLLYFSTGATTDLNINHATADSRINWRSAGNVYFYISADSTGAHLNSGAPILWITPTGAANPRIALGSNASGTAYITIKDTDTVTPYTNIIQVNNAASGLSVFNVLESGGLMAPQLGNDEAETNLLGWDVTTGLITYRSVSGLGIGSDPMVYPDAGIALSTGSAWGTSITDNSSTWDAAQAGHANLTSLSALSYVSASFVKMTAAGTFALDTTVYGTGDVSWGTVTNEYLLLGGPSGDIASTSNLSYNTTSDRFYITGETSISGPIGTDAHVFTVNTNDSVYSGIRVAQGGANTGPHLIFTVSDTTQYLNFSPHIPDGASAISYYFNTVDALTTAGAKLVSIENNDVEKFFIDKDGNVDIEAGAEYRINGVAIGVGAGDVSWGTETGEQPIVYGATAGDIDSTASDFTFNTTDKILTVGGTGTGNAGGQLVMENGTTTYLSIFSDVANNARIRGGVQDAAILIYPNAVRGQIGIGASSTTNTFLMIRDPSTSTNTTTLDLLDSVGTSMLTIYEAGTVYLPTLGDDDTEDHVVAIDDSTGLLTKRSVASISGTTISFGAAVDEIPFTNSGLNDFDYATDFKYNGTILSVSSTVNITQPGGGNPFGLVNSAGNGTNTFSINTGADGFFIQWQGGHSSSTTATHHGGAAYLRGGNQTGLGGGNGGAVYLIGGTSNSGDGGDINLSPGVAGDINIGSTTSTESEYRLTVVSNVADTGLYLTSKGNQGIYFNNSNHAGVIRLGGFQVTGDANDWLMTRSNSNIDSLTINAGTAGVSAGWEAADLILRGGDGAAAVGFEDGGHIYMYPGQLSSGGVDGSLYFGDGTSIGGLAARSSETNVIYYDTTTGLLTYGSPTASGYWTDGGTYLIPTTAGDSIKTDGTGGIYVSTAYTTGFTPSGTNGSQMDLYTGNVNTVSFYNGWTGMNVPVRLTHSTNATMEFNTGSSYVGGIRSGDETISPSSDIGMWTGDATGTGDNTGSLYIYTGASTSGTRGQTYLGDGSIGGLQAKGAETNVVYYNTTSGLITYGTVSAGTSVDFGAATYIPYMQTDALNFDYSSAFKYASGILYADGGIAVSALSAADGALVMASGGGVGLLSTDSTLTWSGNTLIVDESAATTSGGTIRLSNTNTAQSAGATAGEVEFFKSDGSTQGAGIVSYVKSEAFDAGGTYNLIFATGQDVYGAGSNGFLVLDYLGNLKLNEDGGTNGHFFTYNSANNISTEQGYFPSSGSSYFSGTTDYSVEGYMARPSAYQTIDYTLIYQYGGSYGGMFHRQGTSASDLRIDYNYLGWGITTTSTAWRESFRVTDGYAQIKGLTTAFLYVDAISAAYDTNIFFRQVSTAVGLVGWDDSAAKMKYQYGATFGTSGYFAHNATNFDMYGTTTAYLTVDALTGIATLALQAASNQDSELRFRYDASTQAMIGFDASASAIKVQHGSAFSTTPAIFIGTSEHVFIGGVTNDTTYELRVAGDIYASGNIVAYSDIRKKDILGDIELDWIKYKDINPIHYKWKAGQFDDWRADEEHYGFSAQQMLTLFPHTARYADEFDEYSLRHMGITALNTVAIQDNRTEIERLQDRVQELEDELSKN